jgi:hypothetical protein
MGEIIRAARGLAFDGGFICSASSAELFSPTTLRASRLQSMFWPCEGMSLGTATEKTTEWGFTPVYIRPLPASEIRHSRVGIPQFWREDGKQVDMEELKSKKIALVVSTNAKLSFSPQSICLSIPLAVSPSSSVKELTTLSIAQAASLTMAEIARMSDDAISQPKGLALSDIEDLEGRMLTRAVSATLGVARKLSPRQEAQRARKAERAKFTREWEREEQRVGKS